MFNRYFFKNLDKVLLLTVFLIIGISIVMISSATGGEFSRLAQKQLISAVVALLAFLFIAAIDYSKLEGLIKPLYIFGLFLLILVLVIGNNAKGAKSWIIIGGGFNLQPSEIVKLIMIAVLAFVLSKKGEIETFKELIPVLAMVALPVGLIMLQPDLGTVLVFAGITLGMLFMSGLKMKHLGILFAAGGACLPVFWHVLKDYQKNRLLTFIDPSLDPLGAGYNIIQSKIAIGSGGIYGKGIFHGTQATLNFLPEPHTDFIFSVIGEEIGFIGALVILLLYFIIVWRGIKIAAEAKDAFGSLMATGVVCLYLCHILLNVGGATGIMPLTGLPLPLMSYGGSSLVTNMAALGILESVHIRRKEMMF